MVVVVVGSLDGINDNLQSNLYADLLCWLENHSHREVHVGVIYVSCTLTSTCASSCFVFARRLVVFLQSHPKAPSVGDFTLALL